MGTMRWPEQGCMASCWRTSREPHKGLHCWGCTVAYAGPRWPLAWLTMAHNKARAFRQTCTQAYSASHGDPLSIQGKYDLSAIGIYGKIWSERHWYLWEKWSQALKEKQEAERPLYQHMTSIKAKWSMCVCCVLLSWDSMLVYMSHHMQSDQHSIVQVTHTLRLRFRFWRERCWRLALTVWSNQQTLIQ